MLERTQSAIYSAEHELEDSRIRLSRAIGADNRGEISVAKQQDVVTLVGLEICE